MVDEDELRENLDIRGSFEEQGTRNDPIKRLLEDFLDHGEMHTEFDDDASRYVEIRKGTTTFDFEGGVFVVDDGHTAHRFTMSGLTNWHKLKNIFEVQE